jgi:hypothetical protein
MHKEADGFGSIFVEAVMGKGVINFNLRRIHLLSRALCAMICQDEFTQRLLF